MLNKRLRLPLFFVILFIVILQSNFWYGSLHNIYLSNNNDTLSEKINFTLYHFIFNVT